jgi:ribosomal protein S18 acetylase RimI-like enzyme
MITIRPAATADLPALGRMGALLARLHHEWDPQRFMLPEGPARVEEGYRSWLGRELANRQAVVLVAEREVAVVGYSYGRLEERDWNALLDAHGGFHDVWVEEVDRGSGAGRALAEGMVAALVALGAPRVVLKTSTKNGAAQRLFASLGFRPTMLEMTREAGQPQRAEASARPPQAGDRLPQR